MEQDFSGSQFIGDHNQFTRPQAGDDSLFVIFYMGAIRNEAKSVEAGRAIFDDVECMRVIIPGDRSHVVDRPAQPDDKQRWHKQYGLFKQGMTEDAQLSGTRLNEWPFLTRSQISEFDYLGIKTVEQLAEVRDDVVSRVPGLRDIRTNAKVWLGKTKDTAEAAKTAKLITEQANKIDTLERALLDQASKIEQLLRDKQKA